MTLSSSPGNCFSLIDISSGLQGVRCSGNSNYNRLSAPFTFQGTLQSSNRLDSYHLGQLQKNQAEDGKESYLVRLEQILAQVQASHQETNQTKVNI